MTLSIATRMNSHGPAVEPTDVRVLLTAALADITALRASVLLLTAKLDADATVTDTNYAATCNPAAITLLS